MAPGHPALPVSRHTYILHNSTISSIFLWKRYRADHCDGLFFANAGILRPTLLTTSAHITTNGTDVLTLDIWTNTDMNRGHVVELRGSDHRDRRFIEPVHPVEIGFSDELFPPSAMQKIKVMRASHK